MNQWSTDEPIPGKDGFVNLYWLSIAPDKRHEAPDLPAVVRCEVWAQEGGSLCWIPRKYCMQLTHSTLVGALWRPVEAEPTDPFALPISLPLCSFCAKPTEWQCPNCMIDKGMRYPLCKESTGSDCQLRHRAFHKCHLPR